jgi:hypothetical protein
MEQKTFFKQIAGNKGDLNFFMPSNLFIPRIFVLSLRKNRAKLNQRESIN